MIVTSRSWHYRLYCFHRDLYDFSGEPTNLCRYFWTIVLLSLVTAVIAPIAAVIWVACVGADKVYDSYRARRPKKPKPPHSEPGLLRSFLSAKKQKVCPRIQVRP